MANRGLGGYALLSLAGAVVTTLLLVIDPRTIGDVSVWLKPTKFFLSIGVYAGTMAWFFGYVRPERRSAWLMKLTVGALLATGVFEQAWITWQAAHGLHSHFNFDTPLYALMYAMMGVAAVILVGVTLPLAWEIARRPVQSLNPAYRLAVLCGLGLTFALGGSFGGYISASGGSPVGAYASGVPLFAWNQLGGDLRVAHFLGLHALQALPLIAVGLRRIGRLNMTWVTVATLLYAALTIGLWFSARSGVPLIPS